MIDTVKFKTTVDEVVFKAIRQRSVETVRKDHINDTLELKYMTAEIELGTYSPDLHIFAYDQDNRFVSIEFSLPKLCYGENVHLVYPTQVIPALEYLTSKLVGIFPTFPSYEKWELVRLDLCYAWKYPNPLRADALLEMTKLLNYPRKHKHVYKTLVMWGTKKSSVKFYLKEPEYLIHDYKKLVKADLTERADNTLALSHGVLRFETSIRAQQLKVWFEKESLTYKDLLDVDLLYMRLNYALNKVLQNRTPISMDDAMLMYKLETKYGKRKGTRLFTFYKSYFSPDTHLRQMLEAQYNHSTIWRNLRDISEAGIGIVCNLVDFEFNLLIPSDLVINTETNAPGLAWC